MIKCLLCEKELCEDYNRRLVINHFFAYHQANLQFLPDNEIKQMLK